MVSGQVGRWADRSSSRDFDGRYSEDGLRFWVPTFIECGAITAGQIVVDAGCGTGGFGAAIGSVSGAQVIGCDIAERFTRFARDKHSPVGWWSVGNAAQLPLRDNTIDCVLMSLLLHRVSDPAAVVADAARVLRPPGVLVIHTIAPEDAAASAPYRYFPTMASARSQRLPTIGQLQDWSQRAGLTGVSVTGVRRPMHIDADALEDRVHDEIPHRYPETSPPELSTGLQQLRADQQQHGGPWHEPRTHRS